MGRYAVEYKEFAELRARLKLSITQEQVLIGSILGDGCLQLSKNGKSARLQIRNCLKQSEYVDWKYLFFQEWSPRGVHDDTANQSVYFDTLFHKELGEWRDIFYPDGKKIIPAEINRLLTSPLALAIWFMDDGNGRSESKSLRISSYSFSIVENKLLQDCLRENFQIESTIHADSKGCYLYIPAKSAVILFQLIQAHIHPTMQYKFARL